MKKIILLTFVCLSGVLHAIASNSSSEIIKIKLSDGEEITAKLQLPNSEIKTIVLAIHGTGPHTHINKRGSFNFYDEIAKGFLEQGVAFCSYDRRGVTVGDMPPLYHDIDSLKHSKYGPNMEVLDVESIVTFLRNRFSDSRIVLYGLSEGTIVATMVADRNKVDVESVFLHGYVNDNLYDVVQWQNNGYGLFIMMLAAFDQNNDSVISNEEYMSTDKEASVFRKNILANTPFELLNLIQDSILNITDLIQVREPFVKLYNEKVRNGDDNWVKSTFSPILFSTKWLKEHFALEANKTRLLRVDIPIYIFHGTDDASANVKGVYDIQNRFEISNKTNLKVYIFEDHDHDLNFVDILTKKEWSDGYKAIFDTAGTL